MITEAQDAAGNVNPPPQDLPELMDNLTRRHRQGEALPLDELVATGTRVLTPPTASSPAPASADVPPNLAAALEELRAILAELREGGAVDERQRHARLRRPRRRRGHRRRRRPAGAGRPAQPTSPTRADAALATVSPSSEINRDTLRLLQEVRDAARSVNALVTALERRPNSVLFGR